MSEQTTEAAMRQVHVVVFDSYGRGSCKWFDDQADAVVCAAMISGLPGDTLLSITTLEVPAELSNDEITALIDGQLAELEATARAERAAEIKGCKHETLAQLSTIYARTYWTRLPNGSYDPEIPYSKVLDETTDGFSCADCGVTGDLEDGTFAPYWDEGDEIAAD